MRHNMYLFQPHTNRYQFLRGEINRQPLILLFLYPELGETQTTTRCAVPVTDWPVVKGRPRQCLEMKKNVMMISREFTSDNRFSETSQHEEI